VSEINAEKERGGEEGKVVLINNAGVMSLKYSKENARRTLDVNYRGTLRVCPLSTIFSSL
jgi:hypothetical protein